VGEVFHKRDVLHTSHDSPRAGNAVAHRLGRAAVVRAVEAVGGHIHIGVDGGQTLGTVIRIGVVARGIPEQQAGGAGFQLVFGEQRGVPAGALHVEVLAVQLAGAQIHAAVGGVEGKAEGIEIAQVRRDAAEPRAAVILIAVGHDGRRAHKGKHTLCHRIVQVEVPALEAVMPDDAAHAPRSHFHAVKGHRHGHADEIHRVVGVVLRHFGVVVIFGAQPEQARAHVFGELVADGDARAVGVEDRGADAGEGRLDVGLEAHADLGVGPGNDPVHVAVADLDFLAVGAEGGAFGGLAPVLVADFEEHHALQGFRSDHVDLGTQTGSGTHLIVAVMLFKIAVGERYTVLPQARHLEVDRLRGGSCAKNQTGGQQKRHQSLHLPLSFGLNVLRVRETRHSLSSGG